MGGDRSQRRRGAPPSVPLRDGESLRESWRANHTRGDQAIGGKLHLTTRRLIFEPHRFERSLQRAPWECELARVSHVEVAPREWNPTSGALRRRLVVHHEGTVDLFVVNRVGRVADAVADAARMA